MNRRNFLWRLSRQGLVVALCLRPTRFWAQTGKELPIDCSPPGHGAAKPITFNSSTPILPRKSIWDLSSTEISRLQAAYQAMRDLASKTPNDPRGWMQQANVHCFNCSGGYEASNIEIHGSWWFLPWHRCYLHVHERILGKLIGDPSFRLAYWDWDTYPKHATIPPAFLAPGPLWDSYRGATAADVIPGRIVGPNAMSVMLGNQTSTAFMGSASNSGALENNPHGPVHIWTGDPNPSRKPKPVGCFYPDTAGGQSADQSRFGCLDMGVLATAAQDPIFFAHHANIDRLWDVWSQTPGSEGNWKDSDWLKQPFNFYDENGDWIYITLADVLAEGEQNNLRYAYEPSPRATATATPTVTPKQNESLTLMEKPKSLESLFVSSGPNVTRVGTKPHRQSVPLPELQQHNLKAFAALGPTATRHYMLHIEGLSAPANEGTILNVFAGQPNANRKTLIGPSFVGTFSIVPPGPHHEHPTVRNAVFELRPETAALIAKQKDLVIVLVPTLVDGEEPVESNLTYKKIYLSYE